MNHNEHKKRNGNYVWIKLAKNMLLRFNLLLDISYNRDVYSTIMSYKPLPDNLTIKPSHIEGLGLFATETIREGTDLGLTHLLIKNDIDVLIFRTPLGGFINHSDEPNCVRVDLHDKWYLKTKKDINKNEELTLKYTMYKPIL